MKMRMTWIGLLAMGCSRAPSEADEKWWLLPELGDAEADTEDDTEDDDDDEEDGDWEAGSVFWGELYLDGEGAVDGGVVGVFSADDEGVFCEVEYAVESASSVADCPECTLAVALVVGAEDFSDGDCGEESASIRPGETIGVGQAGDTLYLDRGEGWTAGGTSELDRYDWNFEVELSD